MKVTVSPSSTSPKVHLGMEPVEDPSGTRVLFFLLLTICSLIPFFLMPVAARFHADSKSIILIAGLFNFLGADGHVALTYFFYRDKAFRDFFRTRRLRYYYVPVLLIVGTAAVYQFASPVISTYLLVFYFIWQTYHYQRQNYGILSFVGAATKTGRVHWTERATLDLAVIAGILGLFKILELGQGTLIASYDLLLFQAGRNMMYVLPVSFVVALLFGGALKSKLRFWFLLLSSFFYLPTFLFTDIKSAILGYAIAHGLQYYVFMYFVGANQKLPSQNSVRLAMLVSACVLLGGILTLMSDGAIWGTYKNAIFGAYLGFVMVHFVIDAGVWRLKEPFQQNYMKSSFDFVFRNSAVQKTKPPRAVSVNVI